MEFGEKKMRMSDSFHGLLLELQIDDLKVSSELFGVGEAARRKKGRGLDDC